MCLIMWSQISVIVRNGFLLSIITLCVFLYLPFEELPDTPVKIKLFHKPNFVYLKTINIVIIFLKCDATCQNQALLAKIGF